MILASATWEGETILFRSVITEGGKRGMNTVKYKLATSRNSIIAEESLRSNALNYDNVWVLDRRSSTRNELEGKS